MVIIVGWTAISHRNFDFFKLLQVYPFAGIADAVGRKTPRVLINLSAVGSFGSRDSDVVLEGDIVENVKKLTNAIGWEEKLNILEEGFSMRTVPNEE